jgi:hypothetical protein
MMIDKMTPKNVPVFICTAGLAALLLSSCSKIPQNTIPNTPVAGIAITQAMADQPYVDVFVDASKVNQAPVNFGESSFYINVPVGQNSVSFYSDSPLKAIIADTITTVQNMNYSVFLVNTPAKPMTLVLTDTLTKPAAGSASFRFINLSPDAQAVDLVVKGGPVLVANRKFKGFSSFSTIAASASYTFEVHPAGTGTVLATFTSPTLNAGYLYTVWYSGIAGGSTANDTPAISLITNAYFQ